jgi:hypothetical protein
MEPIMPRSSRRSFLRSALAASVAPAFLSATDKAQAAKLIVGAGEHTYEVTHDWLMPPDSLRFGNTHGIVRDAAGMLYVCHTVHASSSSDHAVAVFDPAGRFVTSWGGDFKGGAHGLDLRKEGADEFIYHCDTNRCLVVKTDLKGNVVWSRGVPVESGKYDRTHPTGIGPDSPKGYKPTNVALAWSGEVFVADGYGQAWVHVYDAQGHYRSTLAKPGKGPGELAGPHGIAIDRRSGKELLVVADRSNSRLQYFTLDGRHLSIVDNELVRAPCHFDFHGELMLIPDLSQLVTILGKDNQPVIGLGDGQKEVAAYAKAHNGQRLRTMGRDQFPAGKFVQPHGGRFLPNGDIVISEWVEVGRVSLLRKVGA